MYGKNGVAPPIGNRQCALAVERPIEGIDDREGQVANLVVVSHRSPRMDEIDSGIGLIVRNFAAEVQQLRFNRRVGFRRKRRCD